MSLSLSIVIPSHGRSDLLRRCLETVCRYAPPQTEILVIDDGSPQATASAAANEFPRVRSIRLPRKQGFCAAANTGIRATRGEIVELLNDDTEVTANWADCALANFNDPQVGSVAPLVLCGPASDGEMARIDSAGDRYFVGGVAGKRGHGEVVSNRYLQPCRVFGASASTAFYRKEAVLRVGAFPEEFGAYFEDVDLSFRLQRAGYQVHFEPRSRVYHLGGSSYGKPSRQLVEQQSRNEERVFWRNMTGSAMWSALPKHLLVLAAKAERRWREGSLVPWLLGRARVLNEVTELRRHRRWLKTIDARKPIRDWMIDERF